MNNYPWHSNYPAGVKLDIDPEVFNSLPEMISEKISAYPDLIAFENMGKTLTFKEFGKQADAFASYLQRFTDLEKGDRIAIQMPNLLQYPVCIYGALKIGLIVVNTNPLYTSSEMLHQFNDSGAKAIVIVENFACNLEEILGRTQLETVIVTKIGDLVGGLKGGIVNFVVKNVKKMVPKYSLPTAISFKEVLKKGSEKEPEQVLVENSDLAFLQYTGGTTGVSKGAMLSHKNMVANLEQASAWIAPCDLRDAEEIFITALPLYHIFALTANLFLCLKIGGKNVLITNPRDMSAFLGEMKKHKYSVTTGVNTLFNGMMKHPKFKEIDHSNSKVVLAGGMALQRFVLDQWEKLTGSRIAEAYGLTETSPAVCINPLNENIQIGSIGLPVPSTHIKLVDDDGHEVAVGEKGELCIKGPQVMSGYWNKPKETKQVIDEDGYFKSGDIATMFDTGFFKIVDRKKEMILVSGFNVYPNEIEDCIALHDKVLEVGAIGVPNKKSNEAVKVYIVKEDPSLTEEEIIEHCKERLTGYKRPKHVAFVDELPKSNVGKILRRIIKENDLKENSYL